MSRRFHAHRGIVLTASVLATAAALAACTPPMPPDVLAAKAESLIDCREGAVDVSVPEAFTGAMDAVGQTLSAVCAGQTVAEVPADQPAPVAVTAGTPSAEEIAAFGASSCPTGSTVVVPAFAYPVTMAYNVPGLEGVVMTPQIVAGILNGSITTWEDPLITAANPDFDFTGLAPFDLVSVESPQGAVQAMTAWVAKADPQAMPAASGTLSAGRTVPTSADLITELMAAESAIGVLPVGQAVANGLAAANLPVTSAEGEEIVITSDDVQSAKIGSGSTELTTIDQGLLAAPATGGIPVEGNFDAAAAKIVLNEGQQLVGWPVVGYAHLLVCDDPANPLPVSFAQYVARLAGQGALETFGLTPLPEPIRIKLFPPLKVVVPSGEPAEPSASA